MPEFDWDEANLSHIARHGVTASEVEYVLSHPTADAGYEVVRDEERFVEAGPTATGRVLEVVTILRGVRIRVVTAYDADPKAVQAYYEAR